MKPARFLSYLLTAVLCCVLFGCGKDTTSPPIEGVALSAIEGKVSNWTLGDTMTAVAGKLLNPYGNGDTFFVFGTGQISKVGRFNIALVAPPPEALSGFSEGIPLSDTNARRLAIGGFGARRLDASIVGTLHNANKPLPYDFWIGDYYCTFHFVDRDVNMIGRAKSWAIRETTVVEYDLHYKKGWNRIVNEVVSVGNHVTTHKRTVQNVNTGTWFLDY